MDDMTPFTYDPKDIVLADSEMMTANLFEGMDLSTKGDKLETFLRIRPIQEDYSNVYEVESDTTLLAKKINTGSRVKHDQRYIFTRICDKYTGQKKFYKLCGHPLVAKFIHGNDCLLFAYGTTSSGKSYSIRGTEKDPGVIPRAIHSIFSTITVSSTPDYKRRNFRDWDHLKCEQIKSEILAKEKLVHEFDVSLKNSYNLTKFMANSKTFEEQSSDENTHFVVWLSFVEFYNENLIDLLAFESEKSRLKILDNGSVQGLKHVFVTSEEEALKVYLYGQTKLNKHIQETGLNSQSSRSHSMFTITLIGVNGVNQEMRVNSLSLCDLAGNERSNKTNSTGMRLKEAGKINKSLLALNSVIKALRLNQRQQNYIFRGSVLTRSFKPFLDGTGYASMIINLNPSPTLVDETMGSLDFSATAAEVTVINEESRRQIKESWTRLSQAWITSKERWSSFTKTRNIANNVDTLPNIAEEESFEGMDHEFTELESLVNNDFVGVDVNLISKLQKRVEFLNAQIEVLNAQLDEADNEQFKRDIELRSNLADEHQKMTDALLDEHRQEKEKLIRDNEKLTEQRLQNLNKQRSREKMEYEKRIEILENENFVIREEMLHLTEKLQNYPPSTKETISTQTPQTVFIDSVVQTNPDEERIEDSLKESKAFLDVACGDCMTYKDSETSALSIQTEDKSIYVGVQTASISTSTNEETLKLNKCVQTDRVTDTVNTSVQTEEEKQKSFTDQSTSICIATNDSTNDTSGEIEENAVKIVTSDACTQTITEQSDNDGYRASLEECKISGKSSSLTLISSVGREDKDVQTEGSEFSSQKEVLQKLVKEKEKEISVYIERLDLKEVMIQELNKRIEQLVQQQRNQLFPSTSSLMQDALSSVSSLRYEDASRPKKGRFADSKYTDVYLEALKKSETSKEIEKPSTTNKPPENVSQSPPPLSTTQKKSTAGKVKRKVTDKRLESQDKEVISDCIGEAVFRSTAKSSRRRRKENDDDDVKTQTSPKKRQKIQTARRLDSSISPIVEVDDRSSGKQYSLRSRKTLFK